MKLTTMLNAKKAARAALFYGSWTPGMKSAFKAARDSLSLAIALRKHSVSVEKTGAMVIYSKAGRKLIVPASDVSSDEQALHVVRNFERFFSIIKPRKEENTVDLTAPFSIGDVILRTTPGMLLEIEFMKAYNNHYSLKEGDVVFDCGGYHGLYALLASRQVGVSGKVFVFEPDEKNLAVLRENLRLNSVKNAKIVKKGVWNREGTVKFHENGSSASSVAYNGREEGASGTIEVVSIPSFCKEEGLPHPDFVKMDIEGAEIEAVEGSLEFLKSRNVNFGIASYHLRDGQETCHRLEKLFRGIGYEVVTEVLTDVIITYAWPKTDG